MILSDYTSKNIAVIDLRYIGDCLFLIPLIKNLKANLSDVKITAIVNEGGDSLLRLIPEVHDVIAVKRKEIKSRWGVIKFLRLLKDIRKKNFDTAIVIPHSDRPTIIALASGAKIRIGYLSDSWWRNRLLTYKLNHDSKNNPHLIEYNLQILTDLGLKIYDRQLRINIPEEYLSAILQRYPILKTKEKKSIVIHPGARGFLRQWGADNFAVLINAFSKNYRIYLLGGPSEDNIIREIQQKLIRQPDIISTELSLIEFAALCSFCDLFIGNDSAPIHIAAATGIFVVGLYGPTLPKFCRPWTERSLLFDISTLPCRMCEQDKCLASQIKACINEIKPEQVIEGVRSILEKT